MKYHVTHVTEYGYGEVVPVTTTAAKLFTSLYAIAGFGMFVYLFSNVTAFMVEGGLIYLDKAATGAFAAYEDGFTVLELTRKYYRESGLDVRQLDLLVR